MYFSHKTNIQIFLYYLPSWIPPKTCSLGLTLLCTVLRSSTQPTLCNSFGTQSRKPNTKRAQKLKRIKAKYLTFSNQRVFQLVQQAAIIHWSFVSSVISHLPLTASKMLLRNISFAFIQTLHFGVSWIAMSIFFLLVQSLIYKRKGYKINLIPESSFQFLPGSNLIIQLFPYPLRSFHDFFF